MIQASTAVFLGAAVVAVLLVVASFAMPRERRASEPQTVGDTASEPDPQPDPAAS